MIETGDSRFVLRTVFFHQANMYLLNSVVSQGKESKNIRWKQIEVTTIHSKYMAHMRIFSYSTRLLVVSVWGSVPRIRLKVATIITEATTFVRKWIEP